MTQLELFLVALCAGLAVCVVLQAMKRQQHQELKPGMISRPASNAEEPEWSWTINAERTFTAISGRTRELIGYEPAELIGRSIDLVMEPGELSRAASMITALGGAAEKTSSLIISARHRDGRPVWFDVSVRIDPAADGRDICWSGHSRLIQPDTVQGAATRAVRDRIGAAIADRLLVTSFQPIIELATSNVIGAEALSRFVGATQTAPEQWFHDAAEVGLATELELLAVNTALTAGLELPLHLSISINVSPLTCLDPRLAALIMDSPISLDRVVLELTEHRQVGDYQALNASLRSLRAGGVRIAVDDAGAGFASGQHILRIRPELIKLDRAIVSGIDSDTGQQALTASLVALAGQIGAKVTAEGIETSAELRCVAALGVDTGQGYLLGRPSVLRREWRQWTFRQPLTPAVAAIGSPSSWSKPAPEGDRIVLNAAATAAQLRRDLPVGGTLGGDVPPPSGRVTPAAIEYEAILDALPDPTAVLDGNGVIISVNRAWRVFAEQNGGRAADTGFGVNYLDVCTRAAASGNKDAMEVLAGLRAVLAGDSVEREWEYACGSPFAAAWYISRLSAIGGPAGGAIASHVDVTRLKRSEDELSYLASHDALTGLANAKLFTDSLAEALTPQHGRAALADVGILYIDLDGFKPVNDAFGHATGDELLLAATHRLLGLVRQQDTVGRLGGDEFAICVPRISADCTGRTGGPGDLRTRPAAPGARPVDHRRRERRRPSGRCR